MSKTKMLAAKELIKQRKYNEARAILNTLDYPLAKEWLTQLNRLDPPRILSQRLPSSLSPPPPMPPPYYGPQNQAPPFPTQNSLPVLQPDKTNGVNWKAPLIILTFLVLGLSFLTSQNYHKPSEQETVRARLFRYCLEIYFKVGSASDINECDEWYGATFDVYEAQVLACHRLSPDLDAPFTDCLVDEDILPPGLIRNR